MYSKNIALALVAGTLSILSTVECKWDLWGCPNVQLESSFNLNNYVGMWYEHVRDKYVFYETGDCVQARYTIQGDGTVEVRNSERKPGDSTIKPARAAQGYPRSTTTPYLYVSFFYIDRNKYEIVATDHTNYAVVRSCTEYVLGLFHEEVFWILLRDSTKPAGVVATAENIIKTRAPHYDYSSL